MIGQFVTSKAGHDKGCLYVVVAQKDDFVYLCDGRSKKPEAPKKKRRKHIQPIHTWADKNLVDKLQNGEKVYAEEIKYALKQYCQTCMSNQE